MTSLGDSFPDKVKIEFLESKLFAGQVFYLFCRFTTPPKEKYLLLVCTKPKLLFFTINSEINAFKMARPHLKQCQVTIDKNNHDFLHHNSFVDCTQLNEIRFDDIKDQVVEDVNRVKKMVDTKIIKEVIKAVNNSKTLVRREREWVLDCLSCED